MQAYIYVTYASEDRTRAEHFCQILSRYGFRYRSACEQHETARRAELLRDSALVVALTSKAAEEAETVASDIRLALERQEQILCISLEDNPLDHRFCTEADDAVSLIRDPAEDTPTRHTASLFIHRLFVRHLTAKPECFSPARCTEDLYGETISCAYRAHSGDGEACYELGRAYEQGIGVPSLDVEAALWMGRAAELGVQDARIRMGLYRLWGKGTERNAADAFRLFSLAARDGDARGYYQCGVCYLSGSGVMRDPTFGAECLKRAVAHGYAPALYRLGLAARDGEGMTGDSLAAAGYLYAACRAVMPSRTVAGEEQPLLTLYGHPAGVRYECVSMRRMRQRLAEGGRTFASGKHACLNRPQDSCDRPLGRLRTVKTVFPEDGWILHPVATLHEESAARTAELSVYRRGKYEDDYTPRDAARAACELGKLLETGGSDGGLPPSPNRALVWYRYALLLGSAEAAYLLGDAYRRGAGTPPCPERAVELYRLAAERGDERGQFALAVCLERGIGTEVDLCEAARLYTCAAEGGYAPAQNNLGGCFEHGRGVAQNLLTAVEWYARAAALGQPDAICRLGLCYEYGRGVGVDLAKAISLYRTAAELSHPYARYRLGLCYDHGINEAPVPAPEAMATHVTTRHDLLDRDDHDPSDDPSRQDAAAEGAEETLSYGDGFKPLSDPADTVGEGETVRLPSDPARAVRLYRMAAAGGIPEACYALYLCYRNGRGVASDEGEAMRYLTVAAESGHIQASLEWGLAHMEGQIPPRNHALAVACFTRAAEAWRTLSEAVRYQTAASEKEALPVGGITLRRAAGTALYMLGYCALYGLGDGEGNRRVNLTFRPDGEAVEKAAAYFREAAEAEHVGALTMLGDLYAYGLLIPETASPEDEALRYYMEAARLGKKDETYGHVYSVAYGDSPVDALMSLAAGAAAAARACMAEEDVGGAELAWVNVWRCFSEAAEYGSADALIGMAECLYYGYGAPRNPMAAMRLLRRAETMSGGRRVASLWLGDCLHTVGKQEALSPEGSADEANYAYLRGLQPPPVESECGSFTLGLRRAARLETDRQARAELLHRLAMDGALSSGTAPSKETDGFVYLAEAVRMGHDGALCDLARMYAHRKAAETDADTAPVSDQSSRKTLRKGKGRSPVATAAHMAEVMGAYYQARLPEPEPFSYAIRLTADPVLLPAYAVAEVTDSMVADALYYLGECYFYGHGLITDATAAAECYRRVLDMRLSVPRGTPPPVCVTESAYSLGWCLLYGVGVARDYTEAVKWLTLASSRHAAACNTLALCHELGVGVVAADDREALKYYRKALRFGYRSASRKVTLLEKRLRNAAELS